MLCYTTMKRVRKGVVINTLCVLYAKSVKRSHAPLTIIKTAEHTIDPSATAVPVELAQVYLYGTDWATGKKIIARNADSKVSLKRYSMFFTLTET